MIENIPYFDGHNDLLLKFFYAKKTNSNRDFFKGNEYCHIDYPKIIDSNFVGGFFAICILEKKPTNSFFTRMQKSNYEFPLPDPISYDKAITPTLTMISILKDIIRNSNDKIILCKNNQDIKAISDNNKIGTILHIEGAEAISNNFDSLEILYELGLRSIGFVWSRSNIFGHGVPFAFPKSPDTGPGLSELGKTLVKKCNELKIIIDLSHLNEKGFWDVAKISKSPLVATHSNAHEICPHSRNLTNKQLEAIKDSNGIVGLNFATAFLRDDGQMIENCKLDILLKHFEHLIKYLGEDGVAIGSDFDGAMVPKEIRNLKGINNLKIFMKNKGYDEVLLNKIFSKNWLNFLYKNM